MRLFRVFIMMVAATSLLNAQGRGTQPPPTRTDTGVRRTPDGPVFDFRDQDISVVLYAIAEAANLSINVGPITPPIRTTFRGSTQISKEQAAEIIKSIAEGNGLLVNETPSLIRITAPPRTAPAPQQPQLTPAQQQALALQNRVRVINTVRLKHATASTVAPLLMSLLRGTGTVNTGGRGNVALPGGINIPGLNIGNQGNAVGNAAGGGGGGGRGGRGGGGGGNNQVILPGTNVPVQLGGRGGAAQALQQLLGGGAAAGSNLAFSDINIVADDGTNSLMIFATPEDFQTIQPLIQSIDLRPLQVLLEVTIAQVERSNDLSVGLSGVVSKTKTTGTGAQARTTVDTNAILPGAASARDFIAQIVGGKGAVNYAVALNALQTRGDVRVLSLPIIVAQNNRQAVLNVGSRVPFVSITQSSGLDPTGRIQTVQYQDVGTTLTVTPTINADGYVNLAVTQTADNATPSLQFDAPVISTRQAQTQVFIRDGQTAVFGGLADNTSSKTTSGIPFLSRIPIIGGLLFGNTTRNQATTELFLFLTPHIVSSDEDIDRLRESIRSGSDMLKDVPLHRVNPGGDTIQVGAPRDSVKAPPKRPPRGDTLSVPPPDSTRSVPWVPSRERLF